MQSNPPKTQPTEFRICIAKDRNLKVGEREFAFVFHLSGSLRYRASGSEKWESTNQQAILRASAGTILEWGGESKFGAVIIVMDLTYLAKELDPYRPGLREEVRTAIFEGSGGTGISPLSPDDKQWVESISRPPVHGSAAMLWHRGKMQELLALQAFPTGKPEGEFFCSRQRRIATERVRKVKKFLRARLDEPLDLKVLAKQVGCSSHYLCRTFSNETGITISRFLRSVRIEQAAELLLSGRFNVSEVALEVGYQSLSHFSKAFQQEKGCPPSRYVEAA